MCYCQWTGHTVTVSNISLCQCLGFISLFYTNFAGAQSFINPQPSTAVSQTTVITRQYAIIVGSHPYLFIIHPQVTANLKHMYCMKRSAAVWQCFSYEPSLVFRGGRDRVLAWVLCQVPSVSQQERRPCVCWVPDLRGQPSTLVQQCTELQLRLLQEHCLSWNFFFFFFFQDLHKNKCFTSSMHTMITLDQTEMRKVRSSLSGGKQMMSGWNQILFENKNTVVFYLPLFL